MKYHPLTEAIITSFLIPNHPTRETFRPFGRYRYIHDRLEVESYRITLYPKMFPPDRLEIRTYNQQATFISGIELLERIPALKNKLKECDIILMETIQNPDYFSQPIHVRYDNISKGLPIC